jgi:hypothetical protein
MADGHVQERHARIASLYPSGATHAEIGLAVGLSSRSINSARKHLNLTSRKRADGYWLKCIDEMLSLYQCGFSLSEIAERFGTQTSRISTTLQGHPDYRPRVGGRPPKAIREFEVPGWVSAEWQPRYRLIAQRHGEHVAASCIRAAKRLGVSA